MIEGTDLRRQNMVAGWFGGLKRFIGVLLGLFGMKLEAWNQEAKTVARLWADFL